MYCDLLFCCFLLLYCCLLYVISLANREEIPLVVGYHLTTASVRRRVCEVVLQLDVNVYRTMVLLDSV